MTRSVEQVLTGSEIHMVGDGFRVSNYFPNGNDLGKRISPFFLLDYNPPFEFEPRDQPRGVGVHPHRGFETVTLALSGAVAHHDSAGNRGIIHLGDVQWMTAGSGVLHKEYHEKAFSERGGVFHMLQLWVNLPSRFKMHTPKYQSIKSESMGHASIGTGGELRVIAGTIHGRTGPAETFSPVAMGIIDLQPHGEIQLEHPSDWNTAYLVTEGSIRFNSETTCESGQLALLRNEQGVVKVKAEKKTQLIVLSGEPLNEPIAHYGPFLMNTTEELQQAIRDYQAGKFGVLD